MKFHEKIIRRIAFPGSQIAYSQFGEDLIVAHLFNTLGIAFPTYLDVGANHPRFISNTYYFYKRGCSGILVEPNPRLGRYLRSVRPRDQVLNVGIGLTAHSEADFYLFPPRADGLSTFSKSDAEHWETVGMKGYGKISVESVIKVPVVRIDEIMLTHFKSSPPNFLSLDIEGLDFDVLKGLDFARSAPDVVCVETLAYDEHQAGYKRQDIIQFMLENGYEVYADTRINTIFCRSSILGSGKH